MARKWGDEAKEDVVLDYSEKAAADSDGGAAQPEIAAMADLTLKSRVDDDADDVDDDTEDEGANRESTYCHFLSFVVCAWGLWLRGENTIGSNRRRRK